MHENTIKNLMEAFAGESMARNKYEFWAKQAEKEGLLRVGKFFRETAINEQQHAKELYKLAQDGIKDTITNLKMAQEGEEYEHTKMYPEFAKQARENGDKKAAVLFELIAKVEVEHDKRYQRLIEMVKKEIVYDKSPDKKYWVCSKCGHIHYGEKPPGACPVCKHPTEYFDLNEEV
ncbi:MAG: rubrerythrin family protein [Candidatus Hodarchaeales archaeon]|jgi:rubrerythrin